MQYLSTKKVRKYCIKIIVISTRQEIQIIPPMLF